MKKLILLIFILLASVSSKAQNFVGYSWSDVYKNMDTNGFIIYKGNTEDNIPYIMGTDDGIVRIYYFAPNNQCYLYVYSVRGTTFEQHEKALFDEGYIRMGEKFYKDNFSAEIKWNKKLSTYSTGITFK